MSGEFIAALGTVAVLFAGALAAVIKRQPAATSVEAREAFGELKETTKEIRENVHDIRDKVQAIAVRVSLVERDVEHLRRHCPLNLRGEQH